MIDKSFREQVQEIRARRARLLDEVDRAMRQDKIFRAKLRRGGEVSLTRSTRKGGYYQLTYWDASGEPTGHIDEPTLESAVTDLSGVIELDR